MNTGIRRFFGAISRNPPTDSSGPPSATPPLPPPKAQAPPPSSSSLDELSSSQFDVEDRAHAQSTTKKARIFRSSSDEDSDSELEDLGGFGGIGSGKSAYVPDNLHRNGPPQNPFLIKRTKINIQEAVIPKQNKQVDAILKRRQVETKKDAERERKREERRLKDLAETKALDQLDEAGVLANAGNVLSKLPPRKTDGGDRDDNKPRDLMGALQRTEAFKQSTTWYFFDTDKDLPWSPEVPYPSVCGDRGEWEQSLIADPNMRVRGGLMDPTESELDDVTMFMVNEVCFEKFDRLRDAYSQAINARKSGLSKIISTKTIATLFRRLGALEGSLGADEPIQSTVEDKSRYLNRPWSSLYTVVDLLGHFSAFLADGTRQYALTMLCRLSIDAEVSLDPWASYSIEYAISNLIAGFSEKTASYHLRKVTDNLIKTMSTPSLFLKLLAALPSMIEPDSIVIESPDPNLIRILRQRIAQFRRTLAIRYFLSKDEQALEMSPPEILLRLKQPSFKIGRACDYAWIDSMIRILEFAVDDGSYPSPSDFAQDSSFHEAEKAFNADVDTLADHVKEMAGKIQTGTTNQDQAGARDALDRLFYRLCYSTRTKQKKKKVFSYDSTDVVGDELQRDFMAGFLGPTGVKRDSNGESK
ncbi:MAG: hypothetical protein M1814_002267 [Vezdaea aestivalis]|nr:MAG: hypothetical protein M1814_002267 [Vezdaea aestivalis]